MNLLQNEDIGKWLEALCEKYRGQETSPYRLPACTLFIRLFDETELDEDRWKVHQALYVPVCKFIEGVDDLQKFSVSDRTFIELSTRGMLGSQWIKRRDVEHIYKVLADNMPRAVNLLHTQVYDAPKKTD